MLCAISYHLYNLKNVKNTHEQKYSHSSIGVFTFFILHNAAHIFERVVVSKASQIIGLNF